jgi:hypothetical protein
MARTIKGLAGLSALRDHPIAIHGGHDHGTELASEHHGTEALARVVGEVLDVASVRLRRQETR